MIVELATIPRLSPQSWRQECLQGRLAALTLWQGELLAVLCRPEGLAVRATRVENDEFPSLTPDLPAAQALERALFEQHGVRPLGHPWLKPLRKLPDEDRFFRVRGPQVHEVAVGPVHAGVIEPGHFRFQCNGEHVLHLEIALGYQHRGVERALVGGPSLRSIHYAETAAGDSSIAHATCYSQLCEELAGAQAPHRARALRMVALELERLANHVGDLGALAGDVAFLPTASWCGRLRGAYLNLTAELCGNRFGRGLVRPGGVTGDLERVPPLDTLRRDTKGAVELMLDNSWVRARFEDTGRLSPETARALGLVGPAARACGLAQDVRHELPQNDLPRPALCTFEGGDVLARAMVRWLEVQASLDFLQALELPPGELRVEVGRLAPSHLAVSLVEGWRGAVCHVALTDSAGRFGRYEIVDPSLFNWPGLALAMRGQEISDFPLCNKSFNLSYCGHDL